ncbi:DEAD/DEAH box helicase [Pseudoalteromonas ulvae]|uniref:DEAD/DEAH box helicase n=1 Tax=Pseudoalteromonas ulvae TaxID=107327 RepID=UPI003867869B
MFWSFILLFEEFGIDKRLLTQLAHQGIKHPTDVQQQAIPIAISGQDLFVQSKTGSGKTLAFLVPLLQRLIKQRALSKRDPRALIITPTRELANQVFSQLRLLIAGSNISATKVLGGDNFNDQIKSLKKDPHIIVGTPGRLADHLKQKSFFLSGLELLIIDEADRIMDLGFKDEIDLINQQADHRLRQTLLFSATLEHSQIDAISRNLLKSPKKVTLSESNEQHDDITQNMFFADHLSHKEALLSHFLTKQNVGQCIVFTATRQDTYRLSQLLEESGLKAQPLAGDMTQAKRLSIMDAFSRGQFQVLVTTDIASRGLDLLNVTHVINFDLPKQAEEYVHRIGRTGRAGFKGFAYSLVGPKDWDSYLAIKSFLQHELTFLTVDGLAAKFKGIKPIDKKPVVKNKASTANSKKTKPVAKKKPVKKIIVQPIDIDGSAPLRRKPKPE